MGQEFLTLFESRETPIHTLRLFASERSINTQFSFKKSTVLTEVVQPGCFEGVDYALFSVGADQAKEFAPQAVREGAVVIDNSSAFRSDPAIPLVVPEINMDAVGPDDRIIANPNCCTIILLMGVAPLRVFGRIRRIIVSTYQSASGAGAAAMQELWDQTKAVVEGREPVAEVMPHVFAFNLFNHDSAVGEDGYNGEESKMIAETKKILGDSEILVNPTCVRVPVLRAHSESITVEFEGEAPSVEEAREALAAFPGVKVVDDPVRNYYPMPLDASGGDEVLVGRIRRDVSHPSALSLFVCGDQLRKGAAQNALQIAEHLMARGDVLV